MKPRHWAHFIFLFSTIFYSCIRDEPCCGMQESGDWVKRSAINAGGRSEAVSFTIGNYAYLGTGWDGMMIRLSDFWKYDPAADSWSEVASLPQDAARNSAISFSVNGEGYCGTGYNGSIQLKDFYRFDPAANTWTKLNSSFPGNPRSEAVAFSIGNYGFVGTGNDGTHALADFYRYDANSDRWTSVPFPGEPRISSVVMTFNNKAYLVTGNNDSEYLNDFWVYDPSLLDSNWKTLRPIYNSSQDSYDDGYINIERTNCVAFTVGDKGYLSTGENAGIFVPDTWEYDFASDLWGEKPSFKGSPTTGAVGISVNNRGFIASGREPGYPNITFNNLWEFLPNTPVN